MVSAPAVERTELAWSRNGCVLVLNAGSSSLKFALFTIEETNVLWRGKIERIGSSDAELFERTHDLEKASSQTIGARGPNEILQLVTDRAKTWLNGAGLLAVGHRVVHGGPHLAAPTFTTEEVMKRLRAMERYDPAHQATELSYIEGAARLWPHVPQVACFDTAFHRDLPFVAQRLPVAQADVDRGLRRYGFHGLSYSHLVSELRRLGGDELANSRLVLAHLGSGASLAAVRDGRSVETTMGFTPTGGFPMSSRSGDLDPGVLLWLARHHSFSMETLFEMLTGHSGLRAISETTSDLRTLLDQEKDDPRAAAAVDVFCYHVRKSIGALAAALGGLDHLVFTGGIGEHQPRVRERSCAGLEFLGVELDRKRNEQNAAVVSREGARVEVRVIAADEERVIAEAVRDVLRRERSPV